METLQNALLRLTWQVKLLLIHSFLILSLFSFSYHLTFLHFLNYLILCQPSIIFPFLSTVFHFRLYRCCFINLYLSSGYIFFTLSFLSNFMFSTFSLYYFSYFPFIVYFFLFTFSFFSFAFPSFAFTLSLFLFFSFTFCFFSLFFSFLFILLLSFVLS